MKCKYCGIDILKAKKPNVTGACRRCKYRHYRENDPGAQKRRRDRNIEQSRAKGREWFKKWKAEKPEMYRARVERLRRLNSGRFNHGRMKARKFGQEWSISKEQYAELLSRPCHYCGGLLNETGSGLDRKSCANGYTIENVVSCCGPCNRVKGEILSYEEMVVAMKAVLALRSATHSETFS